MFKCIYSLALFVQISQFLSNKLEDDSFNYLNCFEYSKT